MGRERDDLFIKSQEHSAITQYYWDKISNADDIFLALIVNVIPMLFNQGMTTYYALRWFASIPTDDNNQE